jgi:hypothetical protein
LNPKLANCIAALKASVFALAFRFAPRDVLLEEFDKLYGDDAPALTLIERGRDG